MRRFCPAGGHPWRAVSPEPPSRAQTKAARAGPAGTALGKGSASPFIREETGLKQVQDLPQTTSKGAGIQIQIVFDSKSQTVLHILVPETKNWVVPVYLCFTDSSTVL